MLGVFKDKYLSWMDLPVMTVIDIVEIVIIAFLFYTILLWIKNTRAWMLLKGLLVILVFVTNGTGSAVSPFDRMAGVSHG